MNGNGSGSGDSEDDDEEDDDDRDGEYDRRKESDHRRGEDDRISGSRSNGIYESSSSPSPGSVTDAIDRLAGNKWSTTKSPIITLNYNSSGIRCHLPNWSQPLFILSPTILMITSAILTLRL